MVIFPAIMALYWDLWGNMFSSTVSRSVWVRIIGRSTDPLNLQDSLLIVCSSFCDCNDCCFVIDNGSPLAHCSQELGPVVNDSSKKMVWFVTSEFACLWNVQYMYMYKWMKNECTLKVIQSNFVPGYHSGLWSRTVFSVWLPCSFRFGWSQHNKADSCSTAAIRHKFEQGLWWII